MTTEDERLEELQAYGILDTPPEHAFDHITRLIAHVIGTPTALVTLVDAERQWFKSRYNFDARETDRDISFCAHAILQDDVMVVPDALADDRFRANPLVTDRPSLRFYAGAPLVTTSGAALGTLCVIDYEPRTIDDRQIEALRMAARQVMKELDLRRSLRELSQVVTGRRRTATPELLQEVLDRTPSGISIKDPKGRLLLVNRRYRELLGVEDDENMVGKPASWVLDQETAERALAAEAEVIETRQSVDLEENYSTPDGERIFSLTKFPLIDWSGQAYAVGTIAHDITDQRRNETRLRFLAEHDPLTGLVNRTRFEEALTAEVARAHRYGSTNAVLLIDIDNFKHVNDSLGHRTGDAFIVSVATVLRHRMRETDVVARLGGDEFAVLLPSVSEREARAVAKDVVRSVAEHAPELGHRAVRATVSIGGSVFGPDCVDAADVIAAADTAMYDAKEQGRNRSIVRPSGPCGPEAQARIRVTWAERIRDALARDSFTLYAQPIIDLTGGQPLRYEVLVRMLDVAGELVAPGSFLPVAERFDLVQRIDHWVARTAIRTLSDVPGSTRFHINLSAKSLRDGELLTLVERELADCGVEPDRVVFEVTETAAVANLEESRSFAERLRALGCGFALDDFGTGFSSFYYLKHLPVDVVKIDGDFVRELPRSRIDQIVVESVVRIAAELRCTTVGEFVEDEQTLDLLRAYGVEHAQGYHCGRPRPIGDVVRAAGG